MKLPVPVEVSAGGANDVGPFTTNNGDFGSQVTGGVDEVVDSLAACEAGIQGSTGKVKVSAPVDHPQ